MLLLTQAESFFLKTYRQFPIAPHPASDRVKHDASSRTQIFNVLQAVDPRSKEEAYIAYLGFMQGCLKELQMDASELVRMANKFALEGMQCNEIPRIKKNQVVKMGLQGVPGIRLAAPSAE